jgi:hypothetical protein
LLLVLLLQLWHHDARALHRAGEAIAQRRWCTFQIGTSMQHAAYWLQGFDALVPELRWHDGVALFVICMGAPQR